MDNNTAHMQNLTCGLFICIFPETAVHMIVMKHQTTLLISAAPTL